MSIYDYDPETGEHRGQRACDEARREMIETGQPAADLAEDKGPTWTTEELQRDFDVRSFAAPFVLVQRKSDGVNGSMEFTHSPRIYFGFTEDGTP